MAFNSIENLKNLFNILKKYMYDTYRFTIIENEEVNIKKLLYSIVNNFTENIPIEKKNIRVIQTARDLIVKKHNLVEFQEDDMNNFILQRNHEIGIENKKLPNVDQVIRPTIEKAETSDDFLKKLKDLENNRNIILDDIKSKLPVPDFNLMNNQQMNNQQMNHPQVNNPRASEIHPIIVSSINRNIDTYKNKYEYILNHNGNICINTVIIQENITYPFIILHTDNNDILLLYDKIIGNSTFYIPLNNNKIQVNESLITLLNPQHKIIQKKINDLYIIQNIKYIHDEYLEIFINDDLSNFLVGNIINIQNFNSGNEHIDLIINNKDGFEIDSVKLNSIIIIFPYKINIKELEKKQKNNIIMIDQTIQNYIIINSLDQHH